ncbi:MAG: hypothetical protein IKZ36_05760 [Kiritimatiellae bacterium]|nr:hypothetical protein [Kiritimatiellia bacterium]
MTVLASILLAAGTLAPAVESPESSVKTQEVVVVSKEKRSNAVTNMPRTVKVTSDRSSYLRKEGVLAFEGNVAVEDVEFKMNADIVNLFLDGTNDLKRVVAVGNVAVTNGLRSGTCAKATYNRALSRIVMYGDEKSGIVARLNDNGKNKSQVEGCKITFWVDTEQVEVDGSVITVDVAGGDAKEGAKKLFGK